MSGAPSLRPRLRKGLIVWLLPRHRAVSTLAAPKTAHEANRMAVVTSSGGESKIKRKLSVVSGAWPLPFRYTGAPPRFSAMRRQTTHPASLPLPAGSALRVTGVHRWSGVMSAQRRLGTGARAVTGRDESPMLPSVRRPTSLCYPLFCVLQFKQGQRKVRGPDEVAHGDLPEGQAVIMVVQGKVKDKARGHLRRRAGGRKPRRHRARRGDHPRRRGADRQNAGGECAESRRCAASFYR